MNLREFIERQVEKFAEKIYLYFQDQEVTYEALNRRINQVANGFLELGIRKGDKVCALLSNCPEFLYVWFGLNKIGAVMVPINLALKEREIFYILRHSEAKAIVLEKEEGDLFKRMKKECPNLQNVIVLGDSLSEAIHFTTWLDRQGEFLDPFPIGEEEDAVYVYTSGTTGIPKGVMLSHRTYTLTGESYAYMVGIEPEDRVMTANPLFHINAQAYSVMGSIAARASLILIDKFSASKIWEQAKQYQATKLVLLLAITHILYNRPESEKDRDHSVRKVIAGGAPRGHSRDFERRFGIRLQTIYSLTESPLAIMSPREGESKDGGLGLPMAHPDAIENEVKIVDENGVEIPPRQVGQIFIRNRAMMKGYFKDEKLTLETIRDGWLYTGDSGYRDEEGYFFFTGRMKEIIRRKGENISALEVETVINRHPKVLESAVIGVPSPSGFGDEEVKAYVVLKSNEHLPYHELLEFLTQELAQFKIPRYLVYRTDLPKNTMGRVMKEVLKKERADLATDCHDREKEK
jgi:acyl-CoA synthetase (AMP-forming)/AMP-acid ligase II